MSEAIGFIGLGNLGLPMAANLLDAGYALAVYNRTTAKADTLVERGARRATSPVDVVSRGGVVVSVLWDAEAVEEVVATSGFFPKLGPDGVHVAMCTGSPEATERLAALHREHGCTLVAAPVFGRPEAAVTRGLWIPVSGPQAAKERVRKLLTAMGARGVFDFGEDVRAASIVKLVGNFLIVSATRSLGEALGMADSADVDASAVVAMLTQTLFTSPIYQGYGTLIAEKRVPISDLSIPRKDLGLFATTAQRFNVETPIATLLAQLLEPRATERTE